MLPLIDRFLPPVWVALFFGFAFVGSVVNPPDVALTVLGVAGVAFGATRDRDGFCELLRDHRGVFIASAVLALAIASSQGLSALRGLPQSDRVPAQVAVLLCTPALARFLMDPRIFRASVVLFVVLCLWHFVMLPIEATTGWKLGWNPVNHLERTTWPHGFQAYGLAFQTFSFVGLYLPLFYLAWGPIAWGRVTLRFQPSNRWMTLMPLLWLLPALWVQSRSGFAGALAAGLLGFMARLGRLGRKGWLLLVVVTVAGIGMYLALVSAGKSSATWRWVYLKAYAEAALDPNWLLFGRGWSREAPDTVVVPGYSPLVHSHNDIVQVLFTWGGVGLASYLAFWAALLKLVWQRFVALGEHWPALALVALAPSLLSDVGFHFFEKAAFLAILLAMCVALKPRTSTRPAKNPQSACTHPTAGAVPPG